MRWLSAPLWNPPTDFVAQFARRSESGDESHAVQTLSRRSVFPAARGVVRFGGILPCIRKILQKKDNAASPSGYAATRHL